MSIWILSANPKFYNHEKAFAEQGFIIWKQTRNFQVGDTVYIYCTKPIAQIKYKTTVKETNLAPQVDDYWNVSIDDTKLGKRAMKLSLCSSSNAKELSYEVLKGHGMKYPPQSPGKIDEGLKTFIEPFFEEK